MTNLPIFRKTLDGFVPASDDAVDFFAKTKLGQLVALTAKRPRNLQFHRLFFAILRLISENSSPHISEEAALYFAKLATGAGEFATDSRGEQHFIPGSISFASMDQEAFDNFAKVATVALVARFMVGTAPDAVIEEARALA